MYVRGRHGQLPIQSVPITTNIESLNPTHGEVYSIQHYVIKFVSDLRQVSVFSTGTPVSSTNKTDSHDITEILLKVALSRIPPQKKAFEVKSISADLIKSLMIACR